MTYPSIKETHYPALHKRRVVFVVPHGAGSNDFLRHFPELPADPQLQNVWPLFLSYLEIERDAGATEIAHAAAAKLAAHYAITALVVELNYPRGLVDGGRLRDHALRHCLPEPLATGLQKKMLDVHETSLLYMDRLYESMAHDHASFLIDVHTMASFCPVDATGQKKTFPVSFDRLQEYIDQYLHAHRYRCQRKIDLICSDEQGRKLADTMLLATLTDSLREASYEYLENEPYHAAPMYLSYQHMQKVPSISLDVPKHLVMFGNAADHVLDQLKIDPAAIDRLAATLARGIANAFARKPFFKRPDHP
ncbi:MAG: hypothetical protein H7249_20115 [Chitinophagaceae bacterium]|nr:hypothetical protein [Oligoflexus sp.]